MEGANQEENGAQELPDEEIPVTGELNAKRLKDLMTAVNTSMESGTTDIHTFTEMYFEWTKLFQHFGKAVVIAFKGKFKI